MDKTWFVRGDDGVVIIDPDVAYPLYLSVIGAEEATRQSLETARVTFTRDLKEVLGVPLHIRITAGDDRQWALNRFAEGSPVYVGAFDAFYKELPGTPATRMGVV